MSRTTATLVLVLAACGGSAPPPPAVVAPPPKPVPVAPVAKTLTGVWLGTLATGGKGLRIQLHLDVATTPPTCALDSLDQGAMGIPCDGVVAAAGKLSLAVPAVGGSLAGDVAADANTVTATWKQGGAVIPVVLTRQTSALEAAKIAFDPEMPAADITNIEEITDADLVKLVAREFAPDTGVGVTIGVLAHGQRKVWSFGAVSPDSVFEIGSITKTFTGLVLAQMVAQKTVTLAEPVRALLPKGTVAAPASGGEITLLDLSAQRSGLPRMPDNFKPADETNPYVDYDAKAMYAFIGTHGVALPAAPEFGYSNIGVGLLGQGLAVRAGTTYEALVKREITAPLGMTETGIALAPALAKRFVAGHAGGKVQRGWEFTAFAGAGALRSTAGDMLVYLDAQLHPEHVKARTPEGKTLAAAIAMSHEVRAPAGTGSHIALNWFRIDASGEYWHNGATGGYSSFAVFDPARDFAVVVLVNRSVEDGTLADDIGSHVAQRLAGVPARSL